MHFLARMVEHTNRLLEEEERRKKVLKRILHVLKMVSGQKEHTKSMAQMMLEYESCRQQKALEQKWIQHKISKKQKKEYERDIKLYQEYAAIIMKKSEM